MRIHYRIQEWHTFTTYDILHNRSNYPTVCLLLDTAHRTDHCNTVWGKWIFDSNLQYIICCREFIPFLNMIMYFYFVFFSVFYHKNITAELHSTFIINERKRLLLTPDYIFWRKFITHIIQFWCQGWYNTWIMVALWTF